MKPVLVTKWIENFTIMTLVYYPDLNRWSVHDANLDDDQQAKLDARELTQRLNQTGTKIYAENKGRIYIPYTLKNKHHATPLEAIAQNDFDPLLLPVKLRQQLVTLRIARELEGQEPNK